MFKYTVKRLFQSLFTIFLVVSAVFLLMRLLPTDYYFTEEQLIKLTKEQQQAILKADGYLDSPFVQLARFYKNLVKSEHRAHYFESVDMADDNTLIITLKNASDAAKLKPEQILTGAAVVPTNLPSLPFDERLCIVWLLLQRIY